MSILNTFTFDSTDEITYDTSKVEVITNIDDETSFNPFGTFSGSVAPFAFNTSGSPWISSGTTYFDFDFGQAVKLKDITIQQDQNSYAVWYRIMGGVQNVFENTFVYVANSSNSGDIYHLLAEATDVRYVRFEVIAIPEFQTTYSLYSISGTASQPFAETAIPRSDIETITATSNVEPVENIYDNDLTTFWQSNNSLPQEILFKFKDTKNLSKFEYQSEDNTTYPTAYTLSTSLDNTTYSQVFSSGSITTLSGSAVLTPTQTANYLKLRFTGSASNKLRVDEVILYEKSVPQINVNQIKLKKTVSDAMLSNIVLYPSSQSGSAVVSNIVKGVDGYWQTNNNMILDVVPTYLNNVLPDRYSGSESLSLNFNSKATVDSITIKGSYDANLDEFYGLPVDFIVQGSNDNANYDTLRTIIGNFKTTIIIEFDDTEHNEYLYYRILFTKSSSPYIRIDELVFNARTYPSSATATLQSIMIDKITAVNATTTDVDLINRDVKYILNINNRNYWFNGQAFVQSNLTMLQANSLTDLNANISKLTLDANSKVSILAVMSSNGLGTPIVSGASLTTKNLANAEFVPSNQIRIKGYIAGHVGKPLEMTLSLKRPVKIENQIVAYSANIIRSDANGYFDFTLPCTETAIPAKEKFVVVIQPLNYRVERYTPNQSDIDLAAWIGGNF